MRGSRSLTMLAGLLLCLAAFTPAVAARYGPPPSPEEEEASNNLSVPALFVPSVGVGTPTCTDGIDTVLPDPAQVSTIYPGYWIQGEATWQADCAVAAADTLQASLEWGDNLQFAPLKQRTPIRVEVGLMASAAYQTMTGFGVDNLTPELADRLATYGTNDGAGIADYPEVRIWNEGATVKIVRNSDGLVAYDGAFSAEINSTGRIVYGYNWQKPLAGEYTITFVGPTVEIIAQDAASGAVVDSHTATIVVDVATKAGGGGGGGH